MSRSYRIPLPLALFLTQDELARRGRLTMGFDLMGILGPERMAELLGQVLGAAGWKEQDGKWVVRSRELATWRIDPTAHTIEVDISGQLAQDIPVYTDYPNRATVPPDAETARSQLSEAMRLTVQVALEGMAEQEKEQVVREAVRARQALAEVLKDVYRQALREKAESLGNVVSVSESSQDGTMRIRIEIS